MLRETRRARVLERTEGGLHERRRGDGLGIDLSGFRGGRADVVKDGGVEAACKADGTEARVGADPVVADTLVRLKGEGKRSVIGRTVLLD